jgi:hypothetical protein
LIFWKVRYNWMEEDFSLGKWTIMSRHCRHLLCQHQQCSQCLLRFQCSDRLETAEKSHRECENRNRNPKELHFDLLVSLLKLKLGPPLNLPLLTHWQRHFYKYKEPGSMAHSHGPRAPVSKLKLKWNLKICVLSFVDCTIIIHVVDLSIGPKIPKMNC